MSAENDSPSHNFQLNITNNISPNNVEQNEQALKNSVSNLELKNSQISQEVSEQSEQNNFNISFFLPKELYKNIEGDDESVDNKNNNIFDSNNQKNNNLNANNDMESSNNNKYIEFNQSNNIFNLPNNIDNFNNNNENNPEIQNNNNKELNNLLKRENFMPGNNYFSTNTNINNFFIHNNNNIINSQINNNPFLNNAFYYNNNPNPLNFPQMSNNYPLIDVNNQNSNYIINNSEYSHFMPPNHFQPKNNQDAQNNNNNKQRKKKVIDEYTIEMFGRRGWICDLCNNFNYDTRKKCNRCHILKKPKKIEDYLQAEKNKSMAHRHYWHCKYCGNYNFAFRLNCNRCQAKREDS